VIFDPKDATNSGFDAAFVGRIEEEMRP